MTSFFRADKAIEVAPDKKVAGVALVGRTREPWAGHDDSNFAQALEAGCSGALAILNRGNWCEQVFNNDLEPSPRQCAAIKINLAPAKEKQTAAKCY